MGKTGQDMIWVWSKEGKGRQWNTPKHEVGEKYRNLSKTWARVQKPEIIVNCDWKVLIACFIRITSDNYNTAETTQVQDWHHYASPQSPTTVSWNLANLLRIIGRRSTLKSEGLSERQGWRLMKFSSSSYTVTGQLMTWVWFSIDVPHRRQVMSAWPLWWLFRQFVVLERMRNIKRASQAFHDFT